MFKDALIYVKFSTSVNKKKKDDTLEDSSNIQPLILSNEKRPDIEQAFFK